MSETINSCDECESAYFASASEMMGLCPNCASRLYGYQNCLHELTNGRCVKCYWDGSTTEFIRKLEND